MLAEKVLEQVVSNGLDMFFASNDSIGLIGSATCIDDINELDESEDIIEEVKDIWKELETEI